MTEFRHLSLFTVLFSNFLLYSQSSINAIVSGNLSERFKIQFSIFANDFTGVLLYCIDNNGKQFGMFVKKGVDDNVTLVLLIRNGKQEVTSSMNLCGCDPCASKELKFEVRLNEANLNIKCNSQNLKSFNFSPKSTSWSLGNYNNHVPIPTSIATKTNSVYIMMGNIEPYQGINNVKVYPRKDQLVGCLLDFTSNNKVITFSKSMDSSVDKMRPSCYLNCRNDICNGGKCNEVIGGIVCNCDSTALNGVHCINNLKPYRVDENHSFEMRKDTSRAYFKVTWRVMHYKRYCLFQIINGKYKNTITIFNNKLLMDSVPIIVVSKDGINYVNVIIANNKMIIKTHNNVTDVPFSLNESIKINIGFAADKNVCEIFEGIYDVYLNHSLIEIQPESRTTFNRSTNAFSTMLPSFERSTLSRTDSSESYLWVCLKEILKLAGAFIILVLLVMIIYASYKRINRCFQNKKELAMTSVKQAWGIDSIAEPDANPYYSSLEYSKLFSVTSLSNDEYLEPTIQCNQEIPELPARLTAKI